jgi:hypothetical protein
MQVRRLFYAAVGAPVLIARNLNERVADLRGRLTEEANSLTKTADETVSTWAKEGEKVVDRITHTKVVDELAAKVDFDQVQVQVSKLRDQLEDMLATWRSSFRPEAGKPEAKAEVKPEAKAETPQKKTVTKKAPAKKAAARKAPAKKAAKTPIAAAS